MSVPALRESLRAAERLLADAGVVSARADAELLAAHLMGRDSGTDVSRGQVQTAAILGRPTPEGYDALVALRAERVPLQHLTGRAPFRGLVLEVGPGVFVPRPETEQVAQVAIDEARAAQARTAPAAGTGAGRTPSVLVVDLCTGSGAIALAVAHEVPGAVVHAVELDRDAHAWAERNVAAAAGDAAAGSASGGVRLHRADARTALRDLDGLVDVVVSNPPYVPPGAVPVDPEVARHDPAVALYGLGDDGLEVPRGIVAAAARLLREGGLLVMEHAEVQDAAARDLVTATGAFTDVASRPDLAGRARMVVARRTAHVRATDTAPTPTRRRVDDTAGVPAVKDSQP